MHFLVDLPLASTWGAYEYLWFNSTSHHEPIDHRCSRVQRGLEGRFYQTYHRIPLDFSNEDIYRESKPHIKYWLMTKKADGIHDIEKKTKAKVIIYDIPFNLQDLIDNEDLHDKTAYSLLSRGFSNCSTYDCQRRFWNYPIGPPKTSVKPQEALGGESKDSLLRLFRQLSQLRLNLSFQHGLVQTGCEQHSNLFWFICEVLGHREFVVLLNLNPHEPAYISLYSLTKEHVPLHIHNEYQWPTYTLPKSYEMHINSNNLLIQSQSINIFSWASKMMKPDVLYQHTNQHSQHC
ncbi:unnamed protein product [Adineta ricciae]|uniref:Uncharacterized protein n=1 Tax=Adineta ricciae TaxID=249248 RepID=A0A815RAM5_ADIRI|nr:unnamed protein product [Adineta ricciae]